ncbi:PAS domain S-box protein [Roseivivax sp. CAU 1753]
MDDSGQIRSANAVLRRWMGIETDAECHALRFVEILSRAGRIYFETHLRPLLLVQGQFSEISIELERSDGSRVSVFMNGSATLSEGRILHAHFSMFQNEQRQAFERELVAKRRESDAYRILVRSSPHAIMSVDPDLRIHAWNPAAEDLFGYTEAEAIGQRFDHLLVPPDDTYIVAEDLQRMFAGKTIRAETQRMHKDGSRIHVEKSIAAFHDDTEEKSGFVAIYVDISERKAAEEQIRTLLAEVNHRSKNLLAVVQVIARQTARIYDGKDFLTVFSQRLASLTANQDILINSSGDHVDLETLARAQFAHLIDPDDPRATLGGLPVQLGPSGAQAIGMALFELVTNAAKYGALSQEKGTVTLSWTVTDAPSATIEMTWTEANGPTVTEPKRQGFGFQVTGPILESISTGQTTRAYDASGFRWSLTAPMDRLTE